MSLDFYIMRDPKEQGEGSCQLVGGMEQDEWEALFYNTPRPESRYDENAREWKEWEERARSRLEGIISNYPLLGRAGDYWEDAWYSLEEVEQLRQECIEAQARIRNQVAVNVLGELIHACDEALKRKWGVWLACD